MNEIVCVNCGHVNHVKTIETVVKVVDLRKDDIGLQVITRYERGILRGFGPGSGACWGEDVLYHVDVYLPDADTMREPNSSRSYFRDINDSIRVWRPAV